MKDKRFPTVLGVILLTLILIAGVYLSTKTTTLSSKASNKCEPNNPQITNLTYVSFDFSFTTTSSCSTTLVINKKIYQDSSSAPNTHYFKIDGLSPTTSYQFNLISGGITYSRPEYSFTTTTKPNSSIPTSNLAWGKILTSDNKPVSGAIVYLTISGSQALSALSNKDGNWNISFATSFKENKQDWFTPAADIDEEIIVYSPDGQVTQLTNKTNKNDPVPDIIIGQNNFSSNPPVFSAKNTQLDSSNNVISQNLSLTSPKESEVIYTLKPDIFGQGPANNTFQLNLDGVSTNVTIAGNNIWHWSPSQNLSPGSHKLILTYQNTNITRNFSITPDNSYLSFSATPSATLIPTQIMIPTNIPSSPTSIPTKVPTIRVAKISTTSTLYKSGETFPTYFLIVLSSLLFGISLYYYRK